MKTAVELAKNLREGTQTCKQVLDHHFALIEKQDPTIKAFISLLKDTAYEKANALDHQYQKGNPLPFLAGVPIAIKDNMNFKGSFTTCGSKILENFMSPYDATVIQKLDAEGLIVVGKANLDEFAMGSSTENSAFFTTKNPWDLERVPGGSSGGSAAAVAAGFVPLSLGSDTGGSIRQPAAFCGITGMKPTYGRVSRYGLVAFASSLDQIGPFTRTVEDMAHLLNVICGHDKHDSTSSNQPIPDFTKSLVADVKGLKIAVPKELFGDEISSEVKEHIQNALDLYKKNGATWDLVSMESLSYAVQTYYIVAPAEASANLARFDGVRYGHRAKDPKNLRDMYKRSRGEGFGPEVKRRIILGTYVLSSGYYDAYYLKAQKVRTLIRDDFNRVFKDYDVIMTPTAPTTAFKKGDHANDPLSMYLADIATIPVNMAGLPGMSIPCGFSKGLPVGLQLIGKMFDEATLIRAGHAFQGWTGYHREQPGII